MLSTLRTQLPAKVCIHQPTSGDASIVPSDESQLPDFSKGDGLLPAIAQDAATGEVLMLAYMNRASFDETLATGRAVYFSRSRNKLWRKGEESGNVQRVKAIYLDCDADTILLKVEQLGGAACHEGYVSCFFRQITPEGLKVLGQRVFDPAEVYKAKK
jgi:phosphoribosyl-AMP cyclohydrolase